MRGRIQPPTLKLVGAVFIALFLLATWLAQPVAGVNPPMQGTPRPTLPPPPGTPVSPGIGDVGQDIVTADNCAGLRGTVINWGFHNEPGVTLRLGDGGWEATQITSDDGRYVFGPLGQGVAFLSVDLAADQAEILRPMADHVAIRLRCDFDVIANLGLYSSPGRPDPPATLTMSVWPTTLLPGGTATFYFTLTNDMPHPISHVFVTDYLPDGLTVAEVTTTRGTVEVLDGRMVTVNVGDLSQGGEETIQIVAQADPALAYGTRLQNTASLLYAESAADQAWITLVVGGAEGATAVPAEEMAAVSSPTPTVSQTPAPSDELLPVTGYGAAAVLPVAGFVLALLALGAYRAREGRAAE